MDKSLILKKIKAFYNIKTDAEFARFLGISSQNMYTWIKRNTYDPSTILAKCPDIRAEWLLNGEGEMLKESKKETKNVSGLSSEDTVTISKDFYEILLSQKDIIKMQQGTITSLQETANSQQKMIALTVFQKRTALEEEPVECAIAQ